MKFWKIKYQLWKKLCWHQKKNKKVIGTERKMHRLKQFTRHEYVEITGILSSITNVLLEEYVLLIFEELGIVLGATDIVVCHRLEKTNWVFVKLLNQKDSQYILEEKYKLMNIVLFDYEESKTRKRSRKIFINQSLCLYYCYTHFWYQMLASR